ncbi:MAG: hypothetical protein KGJ34_00510 [Patescibacteria group bacterium]|nr:hypothetical protein [Patescibacteria group bacterium]
MNRLQRHLKNEASKFRLTRGEKGAMRSALEAAISPVPTYAATPSPYSIFIRRFPRATALSSGALAAILLMGGTAYAAQGSLPGDLLYPVKIHVDEPVRGAFAVTPTAKAQWNAEVAQERLQEAQELASQGRLSTSTEGELADNFDTHMNQAIAITQQLQASGDPSAAGLSSTLGVSLRAEGEVLTQIGEDQGNQSTKENSDALAAHARDSADLALHLSLQDIGTNVFSAAMHASSTTKESTLSTSTTSSTSSTTIDAEAASDLRDQAQENVDAAQNEYDKVQTYFDASTSAQITTYLSEAEQNLSAGNNAAASGSTTEALIHYQQALATGVELGTFFKADEQFPNAKLLPSLLGDIITGEQESTSTTSNSVSGTRRSKNGREFNRSIPVSTSTPTASSSSEYGDEGPLGSTSTPLYLTPTIESSSSLQIINVSSVASSSSTTSLPNKNESTSSDSAVSGSTGPSVTTPVSPSSVGDSSSGGGSSSQSSGGSSILPSITVPVGHSSISL